MKRGPALLAILCILLIIPGIIVGAKYTPFHLLWNIPFGLKTEGCLARLRESPYAFIEAPSEANAVALLSAAESGVQFMEYPADVALLFTSGLYSEACVLLRHDEAYLDALQTPAGVSEKEAGAHLRKSLQTYFDLLDQLNVQYPNESGPFVFSETLNAAGEPALPMKGAGAEMILNSDLDMEEIAELMQSAKTASLSVQYGNISVVMEKSVSVRGTKQSPLYTVSMRYEGDA